MLPTSLPPLLGQRSLDFESPSGQIVKGFSSHAA